MAGKNADEVYVAVDGVVSTGVSGTAVAPTSASSSLGATWDDLGYVSDDGVTETTEQSATPLRAWQNSKKVRTIIEDASIRYQLTLIQTSAETVAFYYGGTITAGVIIVDPTAERPTIAVVIDVIDGDNRIRAYAPEAQVVEVGDQVYQNGEPIGYEVTIECAYNETLGGSVKKWYSALESAAAPTITAITPADQGEDDMVKITGLNFTGATAVTFDAINATSFLVDAADTIYAVLPADDAGAVDVIVTNAEGASSAFSYTRT